MTSSRAMGQSLNDLGTNYLIGMHKAPGLTALSSIPQGMRTYCTKEMQTGEEAHVSTGARAGNFILAPGSPLE